MKKYVVFLGCMVLFFLGTSTMNAQSDLQNNDQIDTKSVEEEEGPMMFKFEPNYVSATEKRREEMAQTRRILDTLDISENKRKKLLKDLYKKALTKRLSRALITETKFEEAEN